MQLSDRLDKIVSMVSSGMVVADVGTDHGYVPIALAQQGKASKIIALDVNKGPLERAAANIEAAGLSDYIELRLSDGLEKIEPGTAECIVAAGMGGLLMKRILEDGIQTVAAAKELVLSPQSDISEVRKFIGDNFFRISEEVMLIDEGKYYTVIKAVKGSESTYTDIELKFGRRLLEAKDEVLQGYLLKEKIQLDRIYNNLQNNTSAASVRRLKEINMELENIYGALAYYE